MFFALTRYNTDGSLDATFGSGGKVATNFTTGFLDEGLSDMAIGPDDTIVVAGECGNGSGNANFALARYTADGGLDPTFGSGGKVIEDFGGLDDGAGAVEIQSDGRIVTAGAATVSGETPDFALARYDSDGTLDLSFGTGGKVTTDFSGAGSSDGADSMAIQPDGKIVAGGSSFVGTGPRDFALARYNTDGSLETTFGSGGKLTTDFGGNEGASDVSIQSDGKIVAVGLADANVSARERRRKFFSAV